ncbi:MAG: CxxxxCH/CxxCH domain-containing protein, partial [Nitrospirae bacterium]|nr:CxxxxCH/CxxCH domain-containing protein [Nitrospirota bacterium]
MKRGNQFLSASAVFFNYSCCTLIAALCCVIGSVSMTASAYGANTTTAGTVAAKAEGATSIQVSMPYAGDDNASNTYTIDYKTCVAGTWTNWVTNASHRASPYTAAITGLTENQCYTVRATYADSDGINGTNPQTIQISAGWDNTMLHNSNRFPGTAKWSGDWGTPTTGQYGQIVCATCHTRTTDNIKRVKDTVITAPNSPTHSFPAEAGGLAPEFQSTTAPRGFGDDGGGHASSRKICEVCHSVTSYHRYNTAGQSNLEHNNNVDCITCHPHSLGFKDASACNSCHGAPPGSGTDTNAPAAYAASHARHYNAVSGGLPSSYSSVTNRSTASGYVFDCGTCHSSNNSDHLANQDGTVDLKLPLGGTYAPGSYAGGDNPMPPGSVTFKNSNGTCSNVYCHGNYAGSGKNAAPTWGTASSGACGTCHNSSNSVSPTSG